VVDESRRVVDSVATNVPDTSYWHLHTTAAFDHRVAGSHVCDNKGPGKDGWCTRSLDTAAMVFKVVSSHNQHF
jgi:hypothetical protein